MALVPFFPTSNVWDPLTSLIDPLEGLSSRLLEHGPSRSVAKDASAIAIAAAGTRVDWLETPESHVLKADVPGFKKEDIKVEVEDGNVLKISGTRSHEEVKDTDKWHRAERSHGQFLRRFRLPDNAQTDRVAATVENGELSVTIPKVEKKKPAVRSINIQWSE